MSKVKVSCGKCGRSFEMPWLAHSWDVGKYHDCKPRTVDEFDSVDSSDNNQTTMTKDEKIENLESRVSALEDDVARLIEVIHKTINTLLYGR